MMNKIKKIILALVLLFAFTACAGKSSGKGSSKADSSDSSVTPMEVNEETEIEIDENQETTGM